MTFSWNPNTLTRGSDTSSREWVLGLICDDIGADSWPTYSDTEEYVSEYEKEFRRLIHSKYGEDSFEPVV